VVWGYSALTTYENDDKMIALVVCSKLCIHGVGGVSDWWLFMW